MIFIKQPDDKYYTCRYDRAFKEVMLKEENKDILKCLLESILKVEIEEIEIKNQERNTGSLNVKRKHLDALLKTDVGEIEIEVNSSDKSYVHPRNMAYLCDIYSHHTLVGQNYRENTLFIQINLSYGLKDNKLNRCYKLMDEEGKNFVKNFIIYEFNMDRYKKFWYTKDKEKIEDNKYLIMLDLLPSDLLSLSKDDKVVSKYMEELDRVNEDYEFKEYMSAEEDARKIRNSEILESYEDGIEKGIEKGSLDKTKEIALSMLKDNIDIETIAKHTNLTVDEINNLK